MTRTRFYLLAILLILINGCRTFAPQQPTPQTREKGLASWYGEEFAGRATANGEIFDPLQLTAAHRTLPFGTVVEVKNPRNGQVVMVRINDRGPFVGNRIIDLSYAAADKLGMVDTGVGEVELRVLKVGGGEREAPAPLVVNAGEPQRVVKKKETAQQPPDVAFPLPPDVAQKTETVASDTAVVDRVDVVETRGGTEVRKQVAPDGRSVVAAPVPSSENSTEVHPSAAAVDAAAARALPPPVVEHKIVLQLGAFASEANANALADKARAVAKDVYVEKYRDLNRVRIGPFKTREAAVEMKEKLDTAGIDSMVVSE